MTTMKRRDGGWHAEDQIEFDGPRRLCISTYKIGGLIVTHAAVNTYRPGGYTHAYGGRTRDFGRYVFRNKGRATEKAVAAQHAEALGVAALLIAEAREHYANIPARDN